MKKRKVFLVGACFMVLTFFGAAWAGEAAKSEGQKDYQVFDLGEIYVRAEKPPAVQGMAITNEVSAEDIKATNNRTVAEALAYVPGIRVSTGRKNEPVIQIHGMDQSNILVLIDGVPYYETKYGKLDTGEIPVDNIAKIEVTKGAASVLYGPNALMGVVNIITKKPTEKPTAEVTMEVGENNTNRVSLSHGMKVGIFSYWLNYGHQESNGWRLSGDFMPKIGTVTRKPGTTTNEILEDGGFRNNSGYNTNSFWAKVGIDPNPGSEYYLNFHYINRDKGDPPSLYGGQVFNYFPTGVNVFSSVFDRINKYDDWGIDLSGQQKVFDQLTLKAKLYYHNHVDEYTSYSDQNYSNVIGVSRYEDYTVGGSLISDYRPVDWNIIRLSFNYKGDSHKQRDLEIEPFMETFSFTGSVGLENEFNLIKNLSVVAGVSYDWFKVTDAQKYSGPDYPFYAVDTNKPDSMNELNPMVGATYNFTDSTKLFGSFAKKVRFPTLDQLFSSSSGNINLSAEKTNNYTLGVSQLFSKYAKAELAGFYHDISDFISRDGDPHIYGTHYINYGKIEMIGFELNGELYPMKDLILRAGYTYNQARDKSKGHVANNVVNVPENKIDMGLTYTIPYINTRLDLAGIYMGKIFSQLPTASKPTTVETKVGDYFIANARISTAFLKYFEAYLAFSNIFDKYYESEYGYPGPGRNFYAGISVKY